MDSSDNKNTTENTTLGFSSEENTDTNTASETSPSWKCNLSKRWSKKSPSKSELTDNFLDMKNSLLVQSNNIVGLNKRIEVLERDLSDLIRYINSRL